MAEMDLKKAMDKSYKSIGVVTAYINKCLMNVQDDQSYFEIVNDFELASNEMS